MLTLTLARRLCSKCKRRSKGYGGEKSEMRKEDMIKRRVRRRPLPWEKEKTDRGSKGAKEIREEIERLSSFELTPIGVAVESGYVSNLKVESKHLDYEVSYKGRKIAEIDPTYSSYGFDCRIMPVSFYKGEIIRRADVPTFLIYDMSLEQAPLKDRCMWIRGEDVIKCEHHCEDLGGKPQENYFTKKKDWHRGLETFIAELTVIAGCPKSKTHVRQQMLKLRKAKR
jgi:hypothetical protein